MGTPYKWEIGESGNKVVDNCRFHAPGFSVSLQGGADGGKIEVSMDGGASWMEVDELDLSTDQTIGAVINTRVTNIKFTGKQGDVARIIAP